MESSMSQACAPSIFHTFPSVDAQREMYVIRVELERRGRQYRETLEIPLASVTRFSDEQHREMFVQSRIAQVKRSLLAMAQERDGGHSA